MAANDDNDTLPWILSGIVIVVIAAFDIGITFGNRSLPPTAEDATPASPRPKPLLATAAPVAGTERRQPAVTGEFDAHAADLTSRYTNQYPAGDGDSSYLCDELKEEVGSIRQRMRYPYTSPEGDYYRARLRDLSHRQYDIHCPR
jgi:hypothetical protein